MNLSMHPCSDTFVTMLDYLSVAKVACVTTTDDENNNTSTTNANAIVRTIKHAAIETFKHA